MKWKENRLSVSSRHSVMINLLILGEGLQIGWNLHSFRVRVFPYYCSRVWIDIVKGDTIGYRKIFSFPTIRLKEFCIEFDGRSFLKIDRDDVFYS